MKKTLVSAIALTIGLTPLAYAQGYSSSGSAQPTQPNNSGYYSSGSQPTTTTSVTNSGYSSSSSTNSATYQSEAVPAPHHKKHNNFSFSFQLPGKETIVVNNHGFHAKKPTIEWVRMFSGQPLPKHAVIGGWERQGGQFVCRVNYNGLQPGKLYQGQCIIGYGGRQIPFTNYEVLVSKANLHWVSRSFGKIPHGALQGGEENGRPLYICQADYRNGTHSGKIVGQNCNFAWGEGEVSVPYYKVLAV